MNEEERKQINLFINLSNLNKYFNFISAQLNNADITKFDIATIQAMLNNIVTTMQNIMKYDIDNNKINELLENNKTSIKESQYKELKEFITECRSLKD